MMKNRGRNRSSKKAKAENGQADPSITNLKPTDQEHQSMLFPSAEVFVRSLNGKKCIKRILVANNGIAAVKCMRSIRNWAYATFRNAEVFFFVCMASPEDIRASAEYIKMANKIVMVPGGSNINNYANVELILQTAVSNHVDAVWAGWGHASENPQLPEVLAKHNIAFLGPSHEAMWALGDKIASSILAQSAGVPTVPWSGSHITVDIEGLKKESTRSPTRSSVGELSSSSSIQPIASQLISADDFANASVRTVEQCQAVADRIGYPVMIKASEGGGGKGIRRVTRPDDVAGLFSQVQSEVPDSPIFVMKCMEHVRHLEVQLLADQYGEAISLYGRDCSVQRRHQKIIEEAPCIIAPKSVFDDMEQDAIRLAKLVGYSSAGTVEYLYKPDTQEYFFLELNPRLQVEHPCTEQISNVDLPACQLQIAMGLPLIRIKEIRQFFGLSQSSDHNVSLSTNLHLRRPPRCHVIGVRVTSEDPDEGFEPHSGDVLELNFKSSRSVWGHFSVGTVGGIHEFADSQFGHCFSSESSREKARENMVSALRELLIRGDFRTTVDYLIKILESDAYIRNEIDTEWLDRLIAQKDRSDKPDTLLGVMCTALHIGYNQLEKANKSFQSNIERGQFIPINELSNIVDVTLIADNIKYVLQVVRTGKHSFHLITNGGLQSADVFTMSGDSLLINHESSSYTTYCREDARGYRTVINNRTIVFSKEWDPTILRSPSTGKLVQFIVCDGCHVIEGEVYALMEVMKLILELRAPASGVLFHLRCVGAVLEQGTPIARLQLDDPQKCQSLELFTGQLIPALTAAGDACSASNSMVQSISSSSYDIINRGGIYSDVECGLSVSHTIRPATPSANSDVRQVFERCLCELDMVLLGYALPEPFFSDWLKLKLEELFRCLRDPNLPLCELEDIIAKLSGRLPIAVEQSLQSIAATYSHQLTSVLTNFPSDQILRVVEAGAPNNDEASSSAYYERTSRLVDLAHRFHGGIRAHASRVIVNLIVAYVAVEQHYQHGQYDRCVTLLFARQKEGSGGGGGDVGSCTSPRSVTDLLPHLSTSTRLPDWIKRLADPTSVADVLSVHFSHHHLATKNALVCGLIEQSSSLREGLLSRLSEDLLESLTALTQLGQAENAKVALAAREFLISAQSPPYELRRNQVESIILSAITSYGDTQSTTETLQRLISSETSIFDVLLEFFYHPNPMVVNAALEVYIRRAYITYELTGLQHALIAPHLNDAGSPRCIFFRFLLPNVSTQVKNSPSIHSSLDLLHESPTEPGGMQPTCSGGVFSPPPTKDETRLQQMQSRERLGAIAFFNSFEDLRIGFPFFFLSFEQRQQVMLRERRAGYQRHSSFPSGLSSRSNLVSFQDPPFQTTNVVDEPINVMNIGIRWPPDGQEEPGEDATVRMLEAFCQEHCDRLKSVAVRRVTFMLITPRKLPIFFNFRARDNFKEDRVYRNLEPALAFQLEINRLQNYDLEPIPVLNRRMQLYIGKAKHSQGKEAVDFRFFVRSMIRHSDLVSKEASFEYLRSEAERILLEAMDALEMAFSHPKADLATGNHIFLNFAPTLLLEDISLLQGTVKSTILRYATRLIKLRVKEAELKLLIRHSKDGPRIPIRLLISNEQGYSLVVELYREEPNPNTGAIHLVSYGPRIGNLHGCLASAPHQTKDFLQLKRFQAQKYSSTYVYDYPVVLGQVLDEIWNAFGGRPSPKRAPRNSKHGMSPHLLKCRELCLNTAGELVHVDRRPSLNEIGMVVWYVVMSTPEYPEGRPIVLIANDVTHNAGSFGPCEDLLFCRASKLARCLGIPLIFIAANTGARIRLAEEVKSVYKIAWVDKKCPDKGFNYLYLTPQDYDRLRQTKSVNCEKVVEDGEERYKLVDIIGKDFDISCENLRGSAMIAGKTAVAYEECFTLSIVTSRTIGIGAYLVRLGRRVIQIENSHIILTGAMALNKLLGRQVYTSNSQLGGVQIMANNGVCHLVVPDEFSAFQQMVNWLSFVPLKRGARLPLLRQPVPTSICAGGVDPIDRPVEYIPSRERTNDDPRWMFTGVLNGQFESTRNDGSKHGTSTKVDQQWLSGFFDWGSWQEVLGSWAMGAIAGRARLGGIPCGVITPETRVSVCRVPADPANPASEAQSINQAGQVWYPDSAYKTAQVIADFAREELPLFVFANWRGFSGGLKDMYDQVLKFGAMIVEELITYPCPVFVYLPPHAELRGGAWVVIDPAINPDHMELFCTPDTCRGGVLEPEGTVEIKYRFKDLVAAMDRLDDECKQLVSEVKATTTTSPQQFVDVKDLKDQLKQRHEQLMPSYQQAAHQFADLHDTPGRLTARGLVSACVEWRSSRAFFFALLARRLLEQEAVKCLQQAKIPTVMATKQADCESCPLSQAIDDVPAAKLLEGIVPTLSAKASVDVPTESSEEIQLLNSAEAACQIIAETEAQRSASIRRDLSHLRQWFIEDSRHLSAEAAAQAWEQRHVTVAHWLATQLKHEQLREALSGLRDLQLDSESSVWKLAETTAAHGDSTEEQPTTSGSLPFILPRLDDMKKDQIVNHISQFLEQHPDCVDRLLNSFRGLQVARSDPVTATDPQGSTSSSEAAADTETTHRDC